MSAPNWNWRKFAPLAARCLQHLSTSLIPSWRKACAELIAMNAKHSQGRDGNCAAVRTCVIAPRRATGSRDATGRRAALVRGSAPRSAASTSHTGSNNQTVSAQRWTIVWCSRHRQHYIRVVIRPLCRSWRTTFGTKIALSRTVSSLPKRLQESFFRRPCENVSTSRFRRGDVLFR